MPLFTDSDHITARELAAVDAEVPTLAMKLNIALGGEYGVIRVNWDDCSDQLSRAIVRGSIGYDQDPVLTAHLNLSSSSQIHQVSLAPQYAGASSPWRKWLLYETLKRFFRSATQRNKAEDRLALKFEQYTADADRAWRQACSFGLPVVNAPISAPGAVHDLQAGVWSATKNLSAIAQSSTSARTLYVAIQWVDATRTSNNFSAASSVAEIELAATEGCRVDITNLVPPGSAPHPVARSGRMYRTGKATHWQVYAGLSEQDLQLQSTLIPVATKTFDMTGSLLSGPAPVDGQTYDSLEPMPNIIYRA